MSAREAYVRASLAHPQISEWIGKGLMRQDNEEARPHVIHEYENAYYAAPLAENMGWADRKTNWGAFICFRPMLPQWKLHPFRITYTLKSHHPSVIKFALKERLRKKLPKFSAIVGQAGRMSKKAFVAKIATDAAAYLWKRCQLRPVDLWQILHGTKKVPDRLQPKPDFEQGEFEFFKIGEPR